MRAPIPLTKRPFDLACVVFFAVNLGFITYIVDLEQIVIADPYHFSYPLWPPAPLVDMVHGYGSSLDPLQMARPVWWKATIWIDALLFGPFYAAALWAYVKARDWIRLPAIVWASVMMTNVTIIMSEEIWGPSRTPHLPTVAALNAPWLLFPLFVIARMWRAEHPFTRAVGEAS
jgi:hypothetical protein